jgi:hypothetical protein
MGTRRPGWFHTAVLEMISTIRSPRPYHPVTRGGQDWGRTSLTLRQLFPSREALEGALAPGMEPGMRVTLDQLDTLVASIRSRRGPLTVLKRMWCHATKPMAPRPEAGVLCSRLRYPLAQAEEQLHLASGAIYDRRASI